MTFPYLYITRGIALALFLGGESMSTDLAGTPHGSAGKPSVQATYSWTCRGHVYVLE